MNTFGSVSRKRRKPCAYSRGNGGGRKRKGCTITPLESCFKAVTVATPNRDQPKKKRRRLNSQSSQPKSTQPRPSSSDSNVPPIQFAPAIASNIEPSAPPAASTISFSALSAYNSVHDLLLLDATFEEYTSIPELDIERFSQWYNLLYVYWAFSRKQAGSDMTQFVIPNIAGPTLQSERIKIANSYQITEAELHENRVRSHFCTCAMFKNNARCYHTLIVELGVQCEKYALRSVFKPLTDSALIDGAEHVYQLRDPSRASLSHHRRCAIVRIPRRPALSAVRGRLPQQGRAHRVQRPLVPLRARAPRHGRP